MTDREKVITHFKDAIEASGNNNKWRFVRVDVINDALELLKGPTVSGWVSVKDRMPEFPCITYDVNGNTDFCKTGIVKTCIDGTWYACTESMVHLEEVLHPNKYTAKMIKGNHITFWMPLPEPPEEVLNGNEH